MKRIFPMALIFLGGLFSVGAFGLLYVENRVEASTVRTLPDQLAGLRRTDYRTGDQAVREFENLHGKQFPLTAGAIGVYGNDQITVWVADTASDSVATQMVEAMRSKIAEGNSPFKPSDQIIDHDRVVYVLEGMGQRHYYFQSKNSVIWLAADSALAETALQQTLEAYP